MKILSKLWWIIEVIAVALTFVNPYIGFFAIFTLSEFIILGALSINISGRKKMTGRFVEKTLKILKIVGVIFPIFLFIIKNIVNFVVYMMANVQNKVLIPFNLFADNMDVCSTLLIITFVLNCISLVAYIGKVKGE